MASLIGLALVAGASAQVGQYVATDGGYRIEMAIQPKGLWKFQTSYLKKPNKNGTGRWTKKGRQLTCVVYFKGKPMRGPEGSGVLTMSADGKTLTQKVMGRTMVFKKVK